MKLYKNTQTNYLLALSQKISEVLKSKILRKLTYIISYDIKMLSTTAEPVQSYRKHNM